jgi:uncharacterized membrane protein
MDTIRNPVEWSMDFLKRAGHAAGLVGRSIRGVETRRDSSALPVRQIGIPDIRFALEKGLEDFGAFWTDVAFICVVYPFVGLVLAWFAFHADLLPLLFPLGSGFALIGPVAAVGLCEMSRRREKGMPATWADAFGMVSSPSFGATVVQGLLLLGIFLLWLGAAQTVYILTLGPEPPNSLGTFVTDVLTTGAGWGMIVLGVGVGFVFPVVVLAISVVSFPLLLDKDVGLRRAVVTSIRVVVANPRAMAMWGMIVAGSLVAGSIPLFLGLIIVMPVLGHAPWHLYRAVVH